MKCIELPSSFILHFAQASPKSLVLQRSFHSRKDAASRKGAYANPVITSSRVDPLLVVHVSTRFASFIWEAKVRYTCRFPLLWVDNDIYRQVSIEDYLLQLQCYRSQHAHPEMVHAAHMKLSLAFRDARSSDEVEHGLAIGSTVIVSFGTRRHACRDHDLMPRHSLKIDQLIKFCES